LLIITALHLMRVVFTAAYAPPRRFNYLLGLGLFVLLVLLDFSGYMLRWDQGIQWALVVGTNLVGAIPWVGGGAYRLLVGGVQLGAAALLRFYGWHVFGLMIPVIIVTTWHAFRVRRDGGIAVPPPSLRTNQERINRFELVRREVAAMLLAGTLLLLLALFFPAPIAAPIQEVTAPAASARAPWFFLWVQEMLQWGDPFLWGVAVPLLLMVLMALIPYILPLPAPSDWGHWLPRSNRMAQFILASLSLLWLVLTLLAILPLE
jgi:quinol-cytochrome oxidoreductase complex cytochrome b subunit